MVQQEEGFHGQLVEAAALAVPGQSAQRCPSGGSWPGRSSQSRAAHSEAEGAGQLCDGEEGVEVMGQRTGSLQQIRKSESSERSWKLSSRTLW